MTSTPAPEHWVRLAGEDRDGSIEAFELVSARRALNLLKGNLGRARIRAGHWRRRRESSASHSSRVIAYST